MPAYDYRCRDCDRTFEVWHSMTETPVVPCPECKSTSTSKVPPLVGVVVHSRRASRMRDQSKRESDMRSDMRQNYGIETVQPLRNSSMSEVYNDLKAQGSIIKEQMQESAEKRAAETKAKRKEWMKGALKRTPQRWKEKKERKAAEEAKKRAIVL